MNVDARLVVMLAAATVLGAACIDRSEPSQSPPPLESAVDTGTEPVPVASEGGGGADADASTDADAGACGSNASVGGLGVMGLGGWYWQSRRPQGNTLYALAETSKSDLWAFGDAVILHHDGTSWTPHQLPESLMAVIDDQVSIRGAWASSPSSVWAVGDYGIVLRWDGANWTGNLIGLSPRLFAVWGTSDNDVWAGGDAPTGGNGLLHWNGVSWSAVGAGSFAVRAIAGVSANDVWAAGPQGIDHHHGGTYQRMHAGEVLGAHAFAADDVWFSTATGSLHWNGTSLVSMSGGRGDAIWGPSPNDVWSSGGWHWNGSSWSQIGPGGSRAVRGSSGADVWAVGAGGSMTHFDGVTWSGQAHQSRWPTTSRSRTWRRTGSPTLPTDECS